MEQSFKVMNKRNLKVEWVIESLERRAESPTFNVGPIQCRLSNSCEIDMKLNCRCFYVYLHILNGLPFSFEVTAYLSIGRETFGSLTKPIEFPGRNQTMEDHGYYIWNAEDFILEREVAKLWVLDSFCFKIFFHGNEVHSGYELQTGLKSLTHDLSQLLENSSDHDVSLHCDGQILSAHRNILSARSEVFEAMLKADMQENRTGLVDIPDMVFPALKQLLMYLYTGMLPDMTVEFAVQLYEAADKYAVQALKEECSEFLKCQLDGETACKILLLADAHSDQDLKDRTLEYITDTEIPKQWEGWTDFCESHQKLALEVLNYYILKK